MDSRIGVMGGQSPLYTLSGLTLPRLPYPTTVQLDDKHYVVVDDFPLIDVENELAVLRAGLSVDNPRTLLEAHTTSAENLVTEFEADEDGENDDTVG